MQNKSPQKPSGPNAETHRREKYTDHRMSFLDWVHHSGFERTFIGRAILYIEDKLQIQRFAYVLFYSVILAYLLTF